MRDCSDASGGRSGAAESALIETPLGQARVLFARANAPRGVLALGHGAGGGAAAADLVALAAELPKHGVSVLRVEQPWRVAGRRIAPAPARLDLAWHAVLDTLIRDGELVGPLVLGGRSAGARVACRSAVTSPWPVAGVLALAFPLHPPGRPERDRVAELDGVLAAGLPLRVIQGERDPFGGPAEFPSTVRVTPIPAADHSFVVARSAGPSQDETLRAVATAARSWLDTVLG